MKKIICAIFICVPCIAHSAGVPATVDYIVDGDTFAARVHTDKNTDVSVRVRIRNIDTPEMNGACDDEVHRALRARDRLSEIIPVGTRVELTNVKDDKYLGRIDANVAAPSGRDVGRVLISEKVARSYNGGKRQSWCK